MATSANIAVINLTVQRFYEDLWSPSLPVPTLAGVAKLAIHLLRCLLQTEAGELAGNIYCRNLINTSITCNPTTVFILVLCHYSKVSTN